MNNRVVFIGCGEISPKAAQQLQARDYEVLAVRRNTSELPDSLQSVSADVLDPSSLRFLQSEKANTVVYSLAAAEFTEQSYVDAYVTGLRNTISACNPATLQRIIFVSSTAVYHQNDGSVVNETSPTDPLAFNGRVTLDAENLVKATGIGTALRLSGIYGPNRLRLIDRVKNGQCTDEGNETITNRIHVEDCGGILAHLIALDSLPAVVLGTDSLPATSVEVETFIADQLGVEKKYADNSKPKPKRIAGSKRCDNRLLLGTDYRFIHPDYRSGYQKLIASVS